MTKKLLLADDSVTIQKVVALTFSGEDLDIETAVNGDEALEKARSFRPDIVLADVYMPGRNGYDLCADIKSDPLLSAVPVVLLVGTFEEFDQSEASRANCDAHISKPFDTAELTDLVHSLLKRNRSNNETGEQSGDEPQATEHGPSSFGENAMHVSSRTRESFLGSGRILDCLEPGISARTQNRGRRKKARKDSAARKGIIPSGKATDGKRRPATGEANRSLSPDGAVKVELPEEVLDSIVERVVRRMSREVVREIAWEVIPELSDTIIREYMAAHPLLNGDKN
jgi:CheY-like chemotaxis protein